MTEIIKSLTLPVAMLLGVVFSGFFANFSPLTPYLIFIMLFVTFCRIDPSQMKLSRLHLWLILCQIIGSVLLYWIVSRFTENVIAQGVMICMLAPVATSAPVIAGMLGANVATMATFSLISNLAVAILAPAIFSLVGTNAHMPFMESFLIILKKVAPLLILPFAAAFFLRTAARKIYDTVARYQMVSFYVWALSLMIVSGLTVEFVKAQESSNYANEIWIAAGALIVCLSQFIGGRALGRYYGDVVAGGQSLGQKNTVLAIWMAQTYLNPIASIGPSSYVLWQNIVNSWQLWRKRKKIRNTEAGISKPMQRISPNIRCCVLLLLTVIMTGCSSINLTQASYAGLKALQATTLSDAQIEAYTKQYIEQSDKENIVAQDDDPYAIRLNRIVAPINNRDGINIKVYKKSDVNAFATADGSVRMYSGLMDIMTDEEILGVIGHEIGHVRNKDTKDSFKNALLMSALRDGISSTGGTVGALTSSQLGALGEVLAQSQYSQKQEYAADDYGYEFLKEHGINPLSMALAFDKLRQLEEQNGQRGEGSVNQLFSTHPDIINRTKRMIDRATRDGYAQSATMKTDNDANSQRNIEKESKNSQMKQDKWSF